MLRSPKGSDSPFSETVPDTILLANAPLARVLCQVRWPELTRLTREFESIAQNIGASLATDYPLFAVRQESIFVVRPNGISSAPGGSVYQWFTADGRSNVHFAHTFLTVESVRYASKEDLISQLEKAVKAVSENIEIPLCTRLGYRYTNRVAAGDTNADIKSLIRAEVRGGGAVASRDGVKVVQSVTETLYSVDQDNLLARWAHLPGGVTMDPTLAPVQSESWILDLDAYNESPMDFLPAAIAETAFRLAARGYTFFRWSVTDKFLETFGGDGVK